VAKIQADAAGEAVATWKAVGIGLEFREANQESEAEVRVRFDSRRKFGVRGRPRRALRAPE